MTAQGSIEMAVNSMKMGAFDFLVKPFELDQVEDLIKKGLDRVRLKKEVEWLRAQYQEKFRSGGIIGVSQEMKEVLELAERVAQGSETTVLIEGETGTGKELLAEYIHFLSPRSSFPFIPINCGAIPKDLFESELFGYEKGAFTGALERGKMGKVEAAEKGTLFLDEMGELSPSAQVKVLRVLEEKEYFKVGGVDKKKADVRIIAATNKDLESEIKKGNFRDDLYFRLNVIKLHIPPLRERKEDIFPLFRFFIDRFNEQFKKGFVQISKEAEEKILVYPWTGNIRELRNAVERIVLLEKGDTILGKHLSFLTGKEEPQGEGTKFKPFIPSQGIVLDEVEKQYILEALRIKKGNKFQAAKMLGISRSALLYRMQKHGIKTGD
jgi:DNA-binding NtrC family response regulator